MRAGRSAIGDVIAIAESHLVQRHVNVAETIAIESGPAIALYQVNWRRPINLPLCAS
jgi:hypothetical protein